MSYAVQTSPHLRLTCLLLICLMVSLACGEEPPKPDANAPKPAADAKKPAADAKQPAANAPKPAADAKKPAADAKKPAADKKRTKSVPFTLEWSGDTARRESNHISGRMKLKRTQIAPEVIGLEKEQAGEVRAGVCDTLNKLKSRLSCLDEGDPQQGETGNLETTFMVDITLRGNTSGDQNKKIKKSAAAASSADAAIGGMLALNEGHEHFKFLTRFRASSTAKVETGGWYYSLGATLAEEWLNRLRKRLLKGERDLKPSPAIDWVITAPEGALDASHSHRFMTTHQLGGHTLLCYGIADKTSRRCQTLSPGGQLLAPRTFSMGTQGDASVRGKKPWSRQTRRGEAVLLVGDNFSNTEISKPSTKVSTSIVRLSKEGAPELATTIPLYNPHSAPLETPQGDMLLAAWGPEGHKLIKVNAEGEVLNTWGLGEVVDHYTLLWLDNTQVGIIPDKGDAVYSLNVSSKRSKPRAIWRWSKGEQPDLDSASASIISDQRGGVLLISGRKGESRTIQRVTDKGRTSWSLRLGKQPVFSDIALLKDHVALFGDELRLLELKEGVVVGSDKHKTHAVAMGKDGVVVACTRKGVIAYKDFKPWKSVRLKNSCDAITHYQDGFLATQGFSVIRLEGVDSWETL